MKTKDGLKYVLGIETSADLSAAVITGIDAPAAEISHSAGRRLDSLLVETLRAVLAESGAEPGDLTGIAVSSGPGSFTSLRIGMAAAKGLAVALGIPVAGVPSLDAMCRRVTPSEDCLICPMLDARNGEVYSCLYSWSRELQSSTRITGYMCLPLEKLLEKITGKTIFLCEENFRGAVKSGLGDKAVIMPAEYGRPSASAVAEAAYSRLIQSGPGVYDLRPVYARRPEAEEKARPAGKVTIDKILPEDLSSVLKIEKASFPAPWSKGMFASELAKENSVFLAARTGAELAGYIGGWLVCDTFHLANFAVSPELRGRGIGGKLLKKFIVSVESMGVKRITLEVRENNLPAIAMYLKSGFRVTGRRKKYYPQSGEDAVIMSYGG